MNEEELKKALEEQERRAQEEYDEATKGNEEIRRKREGDQQLDIPGLFEARSGLRTGAGLAFEVGANTILDALSAVAPAQSAGSAMINYLAQKIRGGEISKGEIAASAAASLIPGLAQGKALTRAGVIGRGIGSGAVSGAIETTGITTIDEGRLPTAGELAQGVGLGGAFGGAFSTALTSNQGLKVINDLKDRLRGSSSPFELAGTVGAARRKKISKSPGQMSLSDIDETGGMSEEALTNLYLQRRVELGETPPTSPIQYKGKEGAKIARRLATRRIIVEDLEPILAERPEIPREKAKEYIKLLTDQRRGRNELNEFGKLRRTEGGYIGTIEFLNQKALTKTTGSAQEIADEISEELSTEFTVQDLQKVIDSEGTITFQTEGMSQPVQIRNFEDLQKAYLRRLKRYDEAPAFEKGHVFAVNNIIKDNNITSLSDFANNLEPEIARSIYRQMDEQAIQQIIDLNNLRIRPKQLKQKDFLTQVAEGNRSRKAIKDPDKVLADLFGTGYGLRESFLNFVYPERSLNNIIPADLKEEFAIRYREELEYLLSNLTTLGAKPGQIGPATADKLRLRAVNEVLKYIEPFEGVDTEDILTRIITTSRLLDKTDMVDPATGLLYGQ